MQEIVMTVTSKGQVTIPAEVLRILGIKKNQKIALVINRAGEVKIKIPRYPNIDSIIGKAGRLNRPISWHELRTVGRADRLLSKTSRRHG
jgi:bifunctional DNA-binding transcriptional regulator/antitoxin component of YhaV-PrlF toxin-antitoxin module